MILMSISGVKGDCQVPGFADYFTADSFEFSCEREIKESAKSGTTDVHIGVADMQEISLGKSMDKASMYLMKWAIAGTQINGPVLVRFIQTGTNASGKEVYVNFMNVVLNRVFVKTWSLEGSEDERPNENLTFFFQYFALAYRPFTGVGGKDDQSASACGWDHAKNAPWMPPNSILGSALTDATKTYGSGAGAT